MLLHYEPMKTSLNFTYETNIILVRKTLKGFFNTKGFIKVFLNSVLFFIGS